MANRVTLSLPLHDVAFTYSFLKEYSSKSVAVILEPEEAGRTYTTPSPWR